MKQAEIDKAIAAARAEEDQDERLCTIEGAVAAKLPCARHCAICEGLDHHWLPECNDDGEPLMVCKHCPAWREMMDEDFDDDFE
jgi:hypothetical protein